MPLPATGWQRKSEMFRFLEISLHGWDLWPAMRVPLARDVVLILGPNGSGKTTFLDAIRQILNAPRLSSRRRLQHYLRRPDRPALLRAVVSNRNGEPGAAPFRRERILTSEVTLACALVPSGSGTPEKRFAVAPGRVGVEELQARLLESRDWYGPERYARVLEAAGVEVVGGVLAAEAALVNEAYLKHKRTGLPLVTLKLAMSLDGRIATKTGESHWITGEEARRLVHEMRNRHDAVMVGVGTVLADDPALTTRDVPGGRDALRVICDTMARTPVDARVIAQSSEAGCVVACGESADGARRAALEEAGADVLVLPLDGPHLDLAALMRALGERDVMSVLIEGGGELAWGALAAGIVDKVALFHAPIIIGGREAVPAVGGPGVERMSDALRLSGVSVERIGDDVLIQGRTSDPQWLGMEDICSPA